MCELCCPRRVSAPQLIRFDTNWSYSYTRSIVFIKFNVLLYMYSINGIGMFTDLKPTDFYGALVPWIGIICIFRIIFNTSIHVCIIIQMYCKIILHTLYWDIYLGSYKLWLLGFCYWTPLYIYFIISTTKLLNLT